MLLNHPPVYPIWTEYLDSGSDDCCFGYVPVQLDTKFFTNLCTEGKTEAFFILKCRFPVVTLYVWAAPYYELAAALEEVQKEFGIYRTEKCENERMLNK